MEKIKEDLLILFATQTGNSEEVAERLNRKLRAIGKPSRILSIEHYNISNIDEKEAIIFICSTTGQGEFPESARQFWKFLLRKNLSPSCLSFLKFCVIGLGDSSYQLYNVAAKKLNKRLLQLGAIELLPLTLCDDQHELGYDAAFDSWLKSFLDLVCDSSPLDIKSLNDVLLPPKYIINFTDVTSTAAPVIKLEHLAKLKSNDKITSDDHFQDVHLLKFEIDQNVSYEPGDVFQVLPENGIQNVNEFLTLFNAPWDKEFILYPTDPTTPLPKCLPSPCTLCNCVKSYFDIQSIPKRLFFDIIWHFSHSELEQEKLKEFTTAEGQEELYSYCNRPRRNILEVLQDFPMTTPHIPLHYLFDLIPCIRPRFFSIASSLHYHPREIHLLVAKVKYKTRLEKPRVGLCSTWLTSLTPRNIYYSLKNGSVKLPANSDDPIIMIGPGTGVAPFRSFIQNRVSRQIKKNHLFFGCRYKEKDFLCKDEWLSLEKQELLKLYVSFSRDQDKKIYVQHKLLEAAEVIWDLINNQNAYFYIAGNAKNMPSDVKDAVLNIIEKQGQLNSNDSNNYLKKLENQRRLQVETWC